MMVTNIAKYNKSIIYMIYVIITESCDLVEYYKNYEKNLVIVLG